MNPQVGDENSEPLPSPGDALIRPRTGSLGQELTMTNIPLRIPDGHDGESTTPSPSHVLLATNSLSSLTVQDKRRQGMYGVEAFQQQAQESSMANHNNGCQYRDNPTAAIWHPSATTISSSRPTKMPKIVTSPQSGTLPQRESLHDPTGTIMNQPQIVGGSIFSNTATQLSSDSKTEQQPSSGRRGVALEFDLRKFADSLTGTFSMPAKSSMTDVKPSEAESTAGIQLCHDNRGKSSENPTPVSPLKAFSSDASTDLDCEPSLGVTISSKRKHRMLMNDILPPPSFVWHGTTDSKFTAFQGFLLCPELCLVLAAHFPLRDLVSLYSISRDFHAIIDSRFTTTCLAVAHKKAPESARVFHFRMYSHLCRPDPANRIPHPDPTKAAIRQPRMIPSFKWVAFVLFREKVVHELMAIFAENGVPLPPRCRLALKKMWLLMDIPDNARRIGLIHNRKVVTDLDMYFMFCFLVRLDMMCHDPLAAEKHDGLRKLMLSQRDGLLSVLLVLKRAKWKRQADLLVAWIQHACEITAAIEDDNFDPVVFGAETVFGVPVKEAGMGKYEYWGSKGAVRRTLPSTGQKQRYGFLMRPDQLVMREAVRRQLKFSKVALKSILFCYNDNRTLGSIPARAFPRRIPEWNDEEYAIDDLVGGVSALDVKNGGDPLLDLGQPVRGAPLVVHYNADSDTIAKRTRAIRDDEDAFLDMCVQFCSHESAKIDHDDTITQEELQLLP